MDAIARLLKPRSIAVVGASADPSKTAGLPIRYLRKHGFAGDIYPVNPRLEAIDGLRCYPDVRSLPVAPDVGLVLLGAARAHEAVRDLAAIGATAAIVLASGYAETGEAGARRQSELLAAAGSMRLLGPNTIGLVNLVDAIPISASGALEMERFAAGPIAVVSQSGGILGSLLSRASARGIGLSKLVSTSNEADLDLADFLDHLAGDPDTRVIALYIESVRDAAKFRAAACKAAAAGKPVVAFKVGRSEAGARAAVSHTGALAGHDRMYDALFRQTGVIRAATFADLLDIPATLATRRALRGRRVAILTSTGGAGTLISDSLGVAGFETPPPDRGTARRLATLQLGDHAVFDRNPIDVTLAGLQPEILAGAIAALLASPTYDALAVVVGSSGVAQPELMVGAMEKCIAASDKPVVAYVSPHAPRAASLLTGLGVPAFTAPESIASALGGLWHVSHWQPPSAAPSAIAPIAIANLRAGALDEADAKSLFARFGIEPVREIVVTSPREAEHAARAIGGPVALKILSDEILHKTDAGGVALGLDPEQIGARLAAMTHEVEARTGIRPARFLVQEMVAGGTEIMLGCKRDPLGTAILLGIGGIAAELLADTVLRMLPGDGGLDRADAECLVRELKTFPLLDGYRGRPKADLPALISAIVAFSAMVAQLGDRLIEAEINPLFVLEAGHGVRAADGVVILGA